jgi:nucleoside-diphosphate-sugar epimerase
MHKILITGATGFVGSALAASLLADDHQVVALSRNDPGGQRTRAAVDGAANGFGLALRPAQWNRLSIVEVDFRALEQTLPLHAFDGVTAVWNVAAEMAYSLKKVLDSVGQNVIASSMLYKLAAQHAPDCRRFYHVSTAYTAGMDNDVAREEINFTPRLINSYQLSKWMAEIALVQAHKERALPLTIVRPTIVIGHEQTGWSSGASFGMFLLAAAVLYGKQAGVGHLTLDLEREVQPNLVCIDTVVRRAMALLKSESPDRQATEIFNCIGDEAARMTDVVTQLQIKTGVQISFGTPVSETDARINAVFERNKEFANGRWSFQADRLKQVLGTAYGPATMSQDIIGRSLLHYMAYQIAVAKAKAEAGAQSNAA